MKEPSPASGTPVSPPQSWGATDLDVTVSGGVLDLHPDFHASWLRETLRRAIALLPVPVVRVHVLLVDDARMDAFHRKHSGVAGTTDVLTFPDSSPGEPVAVDIVACVDEALRQSAGRGHSVERELLLYALHGLLHCAGHDDHDPAAYRRMHAEEDRILAAIGVGPTFAPDRLPEDEGDR